MEQEETRVRVSIELYNRHKYVSILDFNSLIINCFIFFELLIFIFFLSITI